MSMPDIIYAHPSVHDDDSWGSWLSIDECCKKYISEEKHKDELAKVVQEAEERTRQKCAEAYWNNPQMGMAEKGRAILNAGKDE